jgi:L-alanine-DL-glutamate epimerase-like enolase superfamily enzyme
MLQEPPTVDETGHVAVPQGPGLGVEIDPELILKE